MAEFSRRTTIGRSTLQRIIRTRGYVTTITTRQVENLATAFGVTADYLRRGEGNDAPTVTRPTEWQFAQENSRLRVENERLRRRRSAREGAEQGLLDYCERQKLEVRRRDGKVVLIQDGEFEIMEAETLKNALEKALAYDVVNAQR